MTMTVVTGASGLVGFRVMEQLAPRGDCLGLYHRERPEVGWGNWKGIDLRSREEVFRLLEEWKPAVIIHSAAACDPVWCEQNPSETLALNLGSTCYLTEWAAAHEAFFVHISTDLVFDGSRGSYREEEEVRPISVYGWSKLAAEEAVRASGAAYAILRTALVYGKSLSGKRGCDEKLKDKWRQGIPTPLFTDEMRTPTSSLELAEKIVEISDLRLGGLFHVAGRERISRYQLGCLFAQEFGVSRELLRPVQIADILSVPLRARDVSLDTTKVQTLLPSDLKGVRENLRREHSL